MTLNDLLYDSLFQTVILGPVTPVVVGVLLGLFRHGSISGSSSPGQRIEIIQENRQTTRVEMHHYHHQPSASDDGFILALGAAILVLLMTWGYVKYLELLILLSQEGMISVALMLGTFFFTTFLCQGVSIQWAVEVCFVSLLFALCYWLTSIPLKTIDPSLIAIAAQSNAWDFYFKKISQMQRNFILIQMIGMVAVVMTMLFATFRGLHLISLAMANASGQGALAVFAMATARFGGKTGGLLLLITALIGWLLVAETRNIEVLFRQLTECVS